MMEYTRAGWRWDDFDWGFGMGVSAGIWGEMWSVSAIPWHEKREDGRGRKHAMPLNQALLLVLHGAVLVQGCQIAAAAGLGLLVWWAHGVFSRAMVEGISRRWWSLGRDERNEQR